MPAHFENGEKCDGSKIWAGVHTIPEQFENGRNSDGKKLKVDFEISRFRNLLAKHVPFSCELEAYPSQFSSFSKCAGIVWTQSKSDYNFDLPNLSLAF